MANSIGLCSNLLDNNLHQYSELKDADEIVDLHVHIIGQAIRKLHISEMVSRDLKLCTLALYQCPCVTFLKYQ